MLTLISHFLSVSPFLRVSPWIFFLGCESLDLTKIRHLILIDFELYFNAVGRKMTKELSF